MVKIQNAGVIHQGVLGEDQGDAQPGQSTANTIYIYYVYVYIDIYT